MPVIPKTVKLAGGDYTTLIGWESGEQTNLVGDGDSNEVYCDGFEDDAVAAAFLLAGWGTDAAHNIKVFGGGAGNLNYPAMPWDETSVFTFRTSYVAAAGISVCAFTQAHTEVYNFQVHIDNAASENFAYGPSIGSECTVDAFIVRLDHAKLYGFCSLPNFNKTNKVCNLVVWVAAGRPDLFGVLNNAAGTTNFVNSLAFSVDVQAGAAPAAFMRNAGVMNVYNCVQFNFNSTHDFRNMSSDDNCATSDGVGTTDLGDAQTQADITDLWTDSANIDFRFGVFAKLAGNGADRSAFTTQDVLGSVRTPWDIGPYETVPTISALLGLQAEFLEGAEAEPPLQAEFLEGAEAEELLQVEFLMASAAELSLFAEFLEGAVFEPGLQAEYLEGAVIEPALQAEFLEGAAALQSLLAEYLIGVESFQSLHVVFDFHPPGIVRVTVVDIGGAIRTVDVPMRPDARTQIVTLHPDVRTP